MTVNITIIAFMTVALAEMVMTSITTLPSEDSGDGYDVLTIMDNVIKNRT